MNPSRALPPFQAKLIAVVPGFSTAALYGWYWAGLGSFPLVSETDLLVLFQAEGLVLHSIGFLGVLWYYRTLVRKKLYLDIVLWVLIALYAKVSLIYGLKGPLFFLAASLATYPHLVWDMGAGFSAWARREGTRTVPEGSGERTRTSSVGPVVGRWGASFFLFFSLWGLTGLSRFAQAWQPGEELFRAGFWYFLALALLEAFKVYEPPFGKRSGPCCEGRDQHESE